MGRELINEIGNKYGKLFVVKRLKHKSKEAHWLCKCDCGNEKIISGCSLRRGHSKSCGCSRRVGRGNASFGYMFRNIKHNANRRNIDFRLSKKQVKYLSGMPCVYCGTLPANIATSTRADGSYIYNGLDRIDNSKGYMFNNVVPCCSDCNKAKLTKSIGEFLNWFKAIIKHNKWKCEGIDNIKFIKELP